MNYRNYIVLNLHKPKCKLMAKIVNFSDAASIGIHGMIEIAKSDVPLNAIQLSEKTGYSKHHIGKILQRLVKDGMLKSYRGPTGGFMLKKKAEEIILYDIYRSIEGEVEYIECPIDRHNCAIEKCIRKEVVNKLAEEFVEYMKSFTLKEYIS